MTFSPVKIAFLLFTKGLQIKELKSMTRWTLRYFLKGGDIVKRERTKKMSPGGRYCKGYFSYEMGLIVQPLPLERDGISTQ
jgi:hypothetical protein